MASKPISRFVADSIVRRLGVLGLNYIQFSELVGVQPSTITRWVSGEHNFTTDTLEKIQNALHINLFAYSEQDFPCYPCIIKNTLLNNSK